MTMYEIIADENLKENLDKFLRDNPRWKPDKKNRDLSDWEDDVINERPEKVED